MNGSSVAWARTCDGGSGATPEATLRNRSERSSDSWTQRVRGPENGAEEL